MTSPFSGLVLGSGALLASPALWAAFVEGTMSMQTALVRFAVAVLVSWVGLSLFAFLVGGTADRADDTTAATTGEPRDAGVAVHGTVVEHGQPGSPAG